MDKVFVIHVISVLLSFTIGYLAGNNRKLRIFIKEFLEERHNIKIEKID